MEVALLGQLLGDAERHADREDRDLVERVGVRQHRGEHGVAALVVGDAPPSPRRTAPSTRVAAPMSTRSRAYSKSMRSMTFAPRRTANSAASLTRFARSAPLMPGVPRATTSRSTSGPSSCPCACTLRIARRSSSSGSGTTTWRSKRPGRSRAGSRMSGRLVAAIITMPSVASKPSISESIWLRVCSRSSWPPPRPAPRLRPIESISSTKMIARPSLRADWNRSRTAAGADADEHLHEVRAGHRQERHAGLAGDGPGDEGLAGARGPDQQHALGDAGADLAEPLGRLEEVDDLADLLLHALVAGDVGEGRARAARWSRSWPASGRST